MSMVPSTCSQYHDAPCLQSKHLTNAAKVVLSAFGTCLLTLERSVIDHKAGVWVWLVHVELLVHCSWSICQKDIPDSRWCYNLNWFALHCVDTFTHLMCAYGHHGLEYVHIFWFFYHVWKWGVAAMDDNLWMDHLEALTFVSSFASTYQDSYDASYLLVVCVCMYLPLRLKRIVY